MFMGSSSGLLIEPGKCESSRFSISRYTEAAGDK